MSAKKTAKQKLHFNSSFLFFQFFSICFLIICNADIYPSELIRLLNPSKSQTAQTNKHITRENHKNKNKINQKNIQNTNLKF